MFFFRVFGIKRETKYLSQCLSKEMRICLMIQPKTEPPWMRMRERQICFLELVLAQEMLQVLKILPKKQTMLQVVETVTYSIST